MKFTGTHPTNYEADLKAFIIKNESIDTKLYLDGVKVLLQDTYDSLLNTKEMVTFVDFVYNGCNGKNIIKKVA